MPTSSTPRAARSSTRTRWWTPCEAGRIAGAALDVYDREPLPPDHRLRRIPNLLLTPHIGYVTREAYKVFYADMVAGIAAFLAGRPAARDQPT